MKRSMVGVITALAACVLLIGVAGADSKEKPAAKEFKRATELIDKGNEALKAGNQEDAYCLYEEARLALNAIKGKYPTWQTDKVQKQIKLLLKTQSKLEAGVCAELNQEKESRFRYNVWKRQVLILRKLDQITETIAIMNKDLDDVHDRVVQ
jgi:hypothetical protein